MMNPTPFLPISKLPGLPSLTRDYLIDPQRTKRFFAGDFRERSDYRKIAQRISKTRYPRQIVAEVLQRQNRAFGCGPQTLNAIDKLSQSDCCAIVTGQQVGLLTGPLYTIYKALTAIQLARQLTQEGVTTCVPVFWLASDDHDLAEIDHIHIINNDQSVKVCRFATEPVWHQTPACQLRLTAAIEDWLQELYQHTPDTEFKNHIMALLKACYAPEVTWSEAFARLMTKLFESFGLVIIDPADARLKTLVHDLVRQEIDCDSPSTQAIRKDTQTIQAAGYQPQVNLRYEGYNLFYTEGSKRRPIVRNQGASWIGDRGNSTNKRELLDQLANKPDVFSPNVVLRPLVQDSILPTLAYVGGPAEIAYMAQLRSSYQVFQLVQPLIYPRKSLTLVETRQVRSVEKLGLKLTDMWRDSDDLAAQIVDQQAPQSLLENLARLNTSVLSQLHSVSDQVVAFEPTLQRFMQGVSGKMENNLTQIQKKIRQAGRRQQAHQIAQVQRIQNKLFPLRQPQERILNIVEFLLKYDLDLVNRVYQGMDMTSIDHQLVEI